MKSNGRYNGSMCTMCNCTVPNGWLVGDEFKPFDIVKKFEVWSIQHDQYPGPCSLTGAALRDF